MQINEVRIQRRLLIERGFAGIGNMPTSLTNWPNSWGGKLPCHNLGRGFPTLDAYPSKSSSCFTFPPFHFIYGLYGCY